MELRATISEKSAYNRPVFPLWGVNVTIRWEFSEIDLFCSIALAHSVLGTCPAFKHLHMQPQDMVKGM